MQCCYKHCSQLPVSYKCLMHFPCIPNCPGIMSQLISGNYMIKFERNSFRVQLSAGGIATCFALAQPNVQVSGGVDCICLPSKSKSQIATTLAMFLVPASGCTENRGLLVAQALLQVTAKVAPQQTPCLLCKCSAENVPSWLTAHCFALQTGYHKRKLA